MVVPLVSSYCHIVWDETAASYALCIQQVNESAKKLHSIWNEEPLVGHSSPKWQHGATKDESQSDIHFQMLQLLPNMVSHEHTKTFSYAKSKCCLKWCGRMDRQEVAQEGISLKSVPLMPPALTHVVLQSSTKLLVPSKLSGIFRY